MANWIGESTYDDSTLYSLFHLTNNAILANELLIREVFSTSSHACIHFKVNNNDPLGISLLYIEIRTDADCLQRTL